MRVRAVLAVAVLGVLAAACGGGGGGGGERGGGGGGTITLSDGSLATDRGTATVSGGTATVEAGDFFFSPTVLTGPAGQEVTLTVSNVGQALHNFSLPDQGVDVDIQAGQQTTVTVTFPSSGAVTFECKYHLAQNMRGELRSG
ncbi:MAG TPA: cupredoxin domain-containing protein [Actinomycetota bacterium]|nr:cupredoxin domain-containing protein [Actinomycetota bacterium]